MFYNIIMTSGCSRVRVRRKRTSPPICASPSGSKHSNWQRGRPGSAAAMVFSVRAGTGTPPVCFFHPCYQIRKQRYVYGAQAVPPTPPKKILCARICFSTTLFMTLLNFFMTIFCKNQCCGAAPLLAALDVSIMAATATNKKKNNVSHKNMSSK